MLTKKIFALLCTGICFASCFGQSSQVSAKTVCDTSITGKSIHMNSFISIFEIPATDLSRAVHFYESILDIHIEKMEMPGMEMGIFPYENQAVTGVIIKAEGYTPSAEGITIYLNGGNNLQNILDKAEQNGGRILLPKTAHAGESGYFALFIDSEGNKIGLHSPQ